MTSPPWQPHKEPLRVTLTRTFTIAIVAGLIVSRFWGGVARWPMLTLLLLWPSFGGHWVELWFLNWLRPRIPASSGIQAAARVCAWFVGGVMLGLGMFTTAMLIARFSVDRWPAWWTSGFVFLGVELIAHLALQLRGRPSFYNGRG